MNRLSPVTIQTRTSDLEARTRAYGKEVFARLDGQARFPLTPGWFDDRLMEWTMGSEAVKVQLFRFIDVLPMLHSPEDVTRHLREYFEEAGPAVPGWLRRGLRWVREGGWTGQLVARAARRNAERLARRFIAGKDAAEALGAVAQLRRQQLAFTVDVLGEATVTETEGEEYQRYYLDLIDGMCPQVNSWPEVPRIDRDEKGPMPRCNFSVKLSSLYSQFDPIDPCGTSRVVRDRLRPILRAARRQQAFVNFDMEQYAYKDLTLRIFREILGEEAFRDWPDVGIAMQAYLRDTEADLEDLYRWAEARGTPVWVRLIKGAYWDYETVIAEQFDWPVPVFTQKWETDANYEKLTRFLLERHEILRPAFGSHNVRSLAHALASAELLGLPPESYEIQMLYGMAGPLQDAFIGLGQRVRIYTPVGQLLPGMAYLVRRLLENTANDSFLRASLTEHVPENELLQNPLERGSQAGNGRTPKKRPTDDHRA
jgi:RHH-type proline utilization regulon transcriptional repressor/proline dehydrogenase/delta 1-pyrroline-5-carboxylate dehydrogenase